MRHYGTIDHQTPTGQIMTIPATELWKVEILERGRCGSINYHEATTSVSFDWEFGGGNTVAIIWIGEPISWENWTVERRRKILQRVADEIIRQKAPSCRADIDEQQGFVYIRENAA
jgi:hypothetical protein